MSLFSVVKLLKDEDWRPFHEALAVRRQTIDGIHAWLLEHGYRVSRSAVGRYRASLARGRDVGELCQAWSAYSDDSLRAKIIEAIQTLTARDLAILAMVAGGMAGTLQPHDRAGIGDGSTAG